MTFHLTLKQRPSCLITNVDLTLKNEGSSSYSLQVTGFTVEGSHCLKSTDLKCPQIVFCVVAPQT